MNKVLIGLAILCVICVIGVWAIRIPERVIPSTPTPRPTAEPTAEPSVAPIQPVRVATDAPPKAPFTGLTIGIDPGHQQKGNNQQEPIAPNSAETKPKVSSGTTGVITRMPEHVVDLIIALKLRDALTKLGAKVIMTRETANVDISNIQRAQMMNDACVNACVRVHCNGSDNASANGMSMYVRKTGACAKESAALAECLLDAMVDKTDAKSLGVIANDTYTGLNWSLVPSVLVEMGFMTNPDEDIMLSDPVYQDRLIEGYIEGFANYFEVNLDEVRSWQNA